MVKRRVYQNEKHVHFVTFSCYRRRQLLSLDSSKRIVIGQLGSRLVKHSVLCTGFVIMPDHVHALLWFPEPSDSVFFRFIRVPCFSFCLCVRPLFCQSQSGR
ncbi:MAG: hypothetical protein HUJ26_15785 [Planctomycetaceae bacterium]|nr:hypothetical protein [Planctomycetaceae bacterium]